MRRRGHEPGRCRRRRGRRDHGTSFAGKTNLSSSRRRGETTSSKLPLLLLARSLAGVPAGVISAETRTPGSRSAFFTPLLAQRMKLADGELHARLLGGGRDPGPDPGEVVKAEVTAQRCLDHLRISFAGSGSLDLDGTKTFSSRLTVVRVFDTTALLHQDGRPDRDHQPTERRRQDDRQAAGPLHRDRLGQDEEPGSLRCRALHLRGRVLLRRQLDLREREHRQGRHRRRGDRRDRKIRGRAGVRRLQGSEGRIDHDDHPARRMGQARRGGPRAVAPAGTPGPHREGSAGAASPERPDRPSRQAATLRRRRRLRRRPSTARFSPLPFSG